jgi:hypothetical protein
LSGLKLAADIAPGKEALSTRRLVNVLAELKKNLLPGKFSDTIGALAGQSS